MDLKTKKRWRGISLYLAVCFLFLCVSVGCQHNVQKDSNMVMGKRTWQEWKSEAGWGSYSADGFQPSEMKIKAISQLEKSKNASFVLVGGSWCPDTQSQFPRIFKIFDLASVAPGKIHLYGVDRQKREPSGTAKQYNIVKVPTLIILSQGKEIGRITEFPESSWEDDMVRILSK